MRWSRSRGALVAALAALVVALGQGVATASTSGHRGPPLDVSRAKLARSLRCFPAAGHRSRPPVLLVPGTTLTPDVNFDWNYVPALRAAGIPVCTVRLPRHAMGDIQVAAEYVVHAIRSLAARADGRIDVIGFSQGGMIDRWALKYWPDTRTMVDDTVGIDPSNHGTLDADAICAAGCAPAFWQQRTGSAFLRALNTGPETWPGISYTQVYSCDDEVVVPNLGPRASSRLTTGKGEIRNLAAQRICPVHVADHLMMGSIDPVAYAVVRDALAHPGPADPSRIDRSVCHRLLMPGVDPARLPRNEARLASEVARSIATTPPVRHEPPLRPYAR
ncbi:MAG: esterase/lipase family protein [Marmoricola sp.]